MTMLLSTGGGSCENSLGGRSRSDGRQSHLSRGPLPSLQQLPMFAFKDPGLGDCLAGLASPCVVGRSQRELPRVTTAASWAGSLSERAPRLVCAALRARSGPSARDIVDPRDLCLSEGQVTALTRLGLLRCRASQGHLRGSGLREQRGPGHPRHSGLRIVHRVTPAGSFLDLSCASSVMGNVTAATLLAP